MTTFDPFLDELEARGTSLVVQAIDVDPTTGRPVIGAILDRARDLGATVSAVTDAPGGPLGRIDDVDDARRSGVLDAMLDVTDQAELTPDCLAIHDVDGLAEIDECGPSVVLRAFAPPAHTPPRRWIDQAFAAAAHHGGDVRARVLGAELSTTRSDAPGVLHAASAAGSWCDIAVSQPERVWVISLSFGRVPHLSVGIAGPDPEVDTDPDIVVDGVSRLRTLAETLTDGLAYACIDVEDVLGRVGTGLADGVWERAGGSAAHRLLAERGDRRVPGIYPVQVLGPAHVAQLRADVGTPVGDHHRLVTVGRPADWLLDAPNRGTRIAQTQQILAPLLDRADPTPAPESADAPTVAPSSADTTDRTAGKRTPERTSPSAEPIVDDAGGTGIPSVDELEIEPGPHRHRGATISPLELAAWHDGLPHSDDPDTVDPAIRTLVRQLGALDDTVLRRRLAGLAPRLGRNADGDARPHWHAIDELIRVHASAWMEQAGLTGIARQLEAMPAVVGPTTLGRPVALLADATALAEHRASLTLEFAPPQARWCAVATEDAWPTAFDRAGGAALSDTALHALPADLLFAVDEVINELRHAARDEHPVDIEALWARAFEELARLAWARAWRAADATVSQDSTVRVTETLHRSIRAQLASTEVVDADLVLDRAERAARRVLAARFADGVVDGSQLFDAAVRALSGVHAAPWRAAVAETRHLLDMAGAERAFDAIGDSLARASEDGRATVGRTVAVAVAELASSAALRAVAARVSVEVAAAGGDAEDGARAVTAHLAPEQRRLRHRTLALVAELVGAPRPVTGVVRLARGDAATPVTAAGDSHQGQAWTTAIGTEGQPSDSAASTSIASLRN